MERGRVRGRRYIEGKEKARRRWVSMKRVRGRRWREGR